MNAVAEKSVAEKSANPDTLHSLKRTINWLASGVAVITVLIIPVLYAWTAYHYESHHIKAEAELAADLVSERIYVNPQLWQFEAQRLEVILYQLNRNRRTSFLRVVNNAGEEITSAGEQPSDPILTRTATLSDGSDIVGQTEVSESLRPLLLQTAWITLFSSLLALTMFITLRVLPIQALDRALRRLFNSQQNLQIAQQELQTLNAELEQTVLDRTNELQSAQAELIRTERLSVLGQLTATVAHELRNPLGTIRSSIFAIDKRVQKTDLDISRATDRITRNIGRCDKIISELLDFTRTPTLRVEPIDLDTWLEEVLSEQTVPEGIELDTKLAANAAVMLDPDRMRRAIINLFDNGCQALAEMETTDLDHEPVRRLTVSTTLDEGKALIVIEDTGPGIPDDVMEHIFEPLYSTKGFGVGLGLPIVRQIIEQHSGEVTIASEVGQGTLISIILPLQELSEEPKT